MAGKRNNKGMQPDRVYVIYGRDSGKIVREALDTLRPFDHLPRSSRIGLKPNLVVAKKSDSGATTSVELIESLVQTLKEQGLHHLTILESSGVGHSTQMAYRVTGLDKLANRYELELLDLKQTRSLNVEAGGFKTRIFQKVRELDYLINLPVIKAHCQTGITCALKNLKGLLPDSEKRRFHSQGLHRPIAALNRIIRQDLIVADGMMGDLSFEEGGTPVRMDRVMIARDPVLLDAFVADCLGYHWSEISHVSMAADLGVGSPYRNKDQVIELNRNLTPDQDFPVTPSLAGLTGFIDERQACSTCLGALIRALHRLQDRGHLGRLHQPLCIGQGFRSQPAAGLGIGACASECEQFVDGCPPSAVDIVKFLSAG